VGTLLLLNTLCESFAKLVKPSQISHTCKKRKKASYVYNSHGIPTASVENTSEDMVNTNRFIQVCFIRCERGDTDY
jgi:hypothetical protein